MIIVRFGVKNVVLNLNIRNEMGYEMRLKDYPSLKIRI